jgi:hypothetical protein
VIEVRPDGILTRSLAEYVIPQTPSNNQTEPPNWANQTVQITGFWQSNNLNGRFGVCLTVDHPAYWSTEHALDKLSPAQADL